MAAISAVRRFIARSLPPVSEYLLTRSLAVSNPPAVSRSAKCHDAVLTTASSNGTSRMSSNERRPASQSHVEKLRVSSGREDRMQRRKTRANAPSGCASVIARSNASRASSGRPRLNQGPGLQSAAFKDAARTGSDPGPLGNRALKHQDGFRRRHRTIAAIGPRGCRASSEGNAGLKRRRYLASPAADLFRQAGCEGRRAARSCD